jgi:hypothetical protein
MAVMVVGMGEGLGVGIDVFVAVFVDVGMDVAALVAFDCWLAIRPRSVISATIPSGSSD